MDLRPTGSKEIVLVDIDTPKMNLRIKGRPHHPKIQYQPRQEAARSHFQVYSGAGGRCETMGGILDLEAGASKVLVTAPLFYEEQNYQIIIESKEASSVVFWHENKLLREAVDYIDKECTLLAGVLNFGSEAGFTRLDILADQQVYLSLALEIFPSKLNYKEDYMQILLDVNREITSLAYDFLRKTYAWADLKDHMGNTPVEFYSVIRRIFDRFIKAVDLILRLPHHKLQVEQQIVEVHKARKPTKQMIRWMQKHPHQMQPESGQWNRKVRTEQKSISYDTFENRVVKHILKIIGQKLQNVQDKYKGLCRQADEEWIQSIEEMKKELQRRVDFSFLKDVGEIHTLGSLSLVLNMAPGYRDVYKYYLMMLKGLSLQGEMFRISTKNIAELYEYWCYIKLNSLMRKKYKLISQDMIKATFDGIFVQLQKGKKSSITYQNPKNGEFLTLHYNKGEAKLPTVAQRPDNILSLQKERSSTQYNYIFDAKYRIEMEQIGEDTVRFGPEVEDINTMHRYRDAIVYENKDQSGFERTVFGAYVLFPYYEETLYRSHPFYESIEKVNVGGLPFLPTATKLVEEFLDQLIEDTPESAFERSTLPKGAWEHLQQIDFGHKNVLIGAVRSQQQLQVNLSQRFYHIPKYLVQKSREQLEYIGLYIGKNHMQNHQGGVYYWGKIVHSEEIKRKEIANLLPVRRGKGEEEYILFTIEKWQERKRPILPKGYGVVTRIYTNFYLLTHADYIPELCVQSREEYRLILELKRITDAFFIGAKGEYMEEEAIEQFRYQGAWISVENEKIHILQGDRMNQYDLIQFRKNPVGTVRQIMKWIK